LRRLRARPDRIDAWVLAELSRRDLVPAIWLPAFELRQDRERARWRLCLVGKRSALKHRVHAQLLAFGHPCPVSDLFGLKGRELLARLGFPEPWRGNVLAAVRMIDELDEEINGIDKELRALGADHRYVPLLMTVPGIAWVLGYTIAAEIGDITRFATPRKLVGYTGLCPRVYQSGSSDRRGPLTHAGPRYLRWTRMEAALHACRHEIYRDRYQHTKKRLGKQRGGPKVAQVDLARQLAEAIWHMLTRNQPFAPAGATAALAA
jgi:transposase